MDPLARRHPADRSRHLPSDQSFRRRGGICRGRADHLQDRRRRQIMDSRSERIMSMMGWRLMYWVFFAVGVIGLALGTAVLLRAARQQRRNVLIAAAVALVLAGL